MSFLTDLPRNYNYDGDLGWLINAYYDLKLAAEDLQKRVAELERLYESIPDEIKKATDAMVAEVNAAIQKMQNSVNQQIADMQKEIADAKKEFQQMQKDMQAQFVVWQNTFNQLVAEFNKLFREIQDYVKDKEESLKYWVYARLAEFSKSYPWLICPVDGELQPLQDILYHMYNWFSRGIKVYKFDGMQITAEQLDGMDITAAELDYYGDDILSRWFDYRRMCHMFSPFTGEYVPISEVVLSLARLHQNAVTAGEFDEADLDVEMLDEKTVSAYDFDWTSQWFDEISGNGAA